MRNLMFLLDLVLIFAGWFGLNYAEQHGVDFKFAVGFIVAAVLAVIGTVPRRSLLGKTKLDGLAYTAFEAARALAYASPVLMLVGPHPVAGSIGFLCVVGVINLMRFNARKILSYREDAKSRNYIPDRVVRILGWAKSANSALMIALSASVFLGSLKMYFLGSSMVLLYLICFAWVVLSLQCLFMAFKQGPHAEHNYYDRHVQDYVDHCLHHKVCDVIHYAGGAVSAVSDIAKRLKEQGRPSVVLARDLSSHNRALKAGLSSVLVKRIADLDHVVLPFLERIHYSGNTQRAGHVVRFRTAQHILHVKEIPSSTRGFPEYLAMYDAVASKKTPDKAQQSHAKWLGVELLPATLKSQRGSK